MHIRAQNCSTGVLTGWDIRCRFAPRSVRNLWSSFLAISMAFPHILMDFQSISVDFSHFQSFSITFNHFRSLPVTINHCDSVKNTGIDWQPEGGETTLKRQHRLTHSAGLLLPSPGTVREEGETQGKTTHPKNTRPNKTILWACTNSLHKLFLLVLFLLRRGEGDNLYKQFRNRLCKQCFYLGKWALWETCLSFQEAFCRECTDTQMESPQENRPKLKVIATTHTPQVAKMSPQNMQ